MCGPTKGSGSRLYAALFAPAGPSLLPVRLFAIFHRSASRRFLHSNIRLFNLPLKLSQNPFSHGLAGSIYSGPVSRLISQSRGIVKLTAVGDNRLMESLYRRHRFPPEVISHAVWLYHRFALSFRDVEDLLAERGITVR